MSTPVYLTGFEHGVATPSANGGGLFDSIVGSPTIQSTVKNSGSYAYRLQVSTAAKNVSKNIGTSTVRVIRLYFRLDDLPDISGGFAELFNLRTASGAFLYFQVYTDNKIMFSWSGGPGVNLIWDVPSTSTWYRLDAKIVVGSTTWTLDWQIDGVTQTAGSWGGQTSTSFDTLFLLGCESTLGGADTWDAYIDDVVVSHTSGDYPIGAGGTEALLPTSDGTHNAGANVMEDNAGTDIGATTAYDKVDAIPMSGATTYIRQAVNGTGNYAEVQFGNIVAAHSAIIGAFGILAYTSATTTANNGGCIMSKDDFATSTTIWGIAGSLQDYSDGSTSDLYYKSALLSNVNDDTTVNALEARMGYSSDAAPDPYWINLAVEVAYTAAVVTGWGLLLSDSRNRLVTS